MDLAALPRGPLEVALHGGFETLVVVGDYQFDTFEPPSFQGAKQLMVDRFALGVCNFYRQDLPKAVLAHC